MAIDTRAKRASLVGIVYSQPIGVTNDATPDQGWRQAAGWGYVGILANNPTPVTAREVRRAFLGTLTEPVLGGSW